MTGISESKPKMQSRQVKFRPGEVERLQAFYAQRFPDDYIAYKLGRTVGSVQALINSLRSIGKLPRRARVGGGA